MVEPDSSTDSNRIHKELYRHVEHLSSTIGERHLWKPGSLDGAVDYIESVFEENGYTPARRNFIAYEKIVANVIAEKTGAGRGLIIIGAHYDTVPGSPGADDNASAIAVMLVLAGMLRNSFTRKTIVFAAFVNEESPCFGTAKMGSLVYARSLKEQGVGIDLMISLEMLGFFRSDQHQHYPFSPMKLFYPASGDFLAVIGNPASFRYTSFLKKEMRKCLSFKVRSLTLPEQAGGIHRSDHYSFWKQGFKAVMLTDTANFRNPHYHEETDTIDTLNFGAMAEIVEGLANAMAHI